MENRQVEVKMKKTALFAIVALLIAATAAFATAEKVEDAALQKADAEGTVRVLIKLDDSPFLKLSSNQGKLAKTLAQKSFFLHPTPPPRQ